MTNPKEALEWYERKRVEARAMADRDCNNCVHHKPDGCSRWECEYEPKDMVEVVRCKDCKHAHMTYGGECKYCDMWEEDGEALYLEGDFFCAYGERREP